MCFDAFVVFLCILVLCSVFQVVLVLVLDCVLVFVSFVVWLNFGLRIGLSRYCSG